jgi:hypothetical protein
MTNNISSEIDLEWDRISLNPDNMIVSDVLHDALSEYYTETPTKTQRAVVALFSADKSAPVSMRLLRFEQSPAGWALVCVCSTQTAFNIMKKSREDWTHADLKIGSDKIREFIIDKTCFKIDVEIPAVQSANAFECTVIASCLAEQSANT